MHEKQSIVEAANWYALLNRTITPNMYLEFRINLYCKATLEMYYVLSFIGMHFILFH